ncbi:hypothetical protein FKM82_002832 [Ascaphus truei]
MTQRSLLSPLNTGTQLQPCSGLTLACISAWCGTEWEHSCSRKQKCKSHTWDIFWMQTKGKPYHKVRLPF